MRGARLDAMDWAVVASQEAGRAAGDLAAAASSGGKPDLSDRVMRARLRNALLVLHAAQDAVQTALARLGEDGEVQ
jgi:hypothetical protein